MSATETPRRRRVPIVTGLTAAAITACVVAATAGPAAAATLPQAQSVGNFLDATLGGNTLDAVAKLDYAKAKAPGTNGTQNPLDVTALNAINLPLTGALQLPQLLGITLGAVNQVAKANVDGSSYGASGAVQNSGGVSVGGDNSAYPANATINLTAAGLAGNSPIPIPGAGSAAALGGITATIGGVAGLVSTPKGYGKKASTKYQIANVDLTIGSPALGALLGGVLSQLTGALGTAANALGKVTGGLTGCDLTSGAVPSTISLEGGAVVIDPATASIKVSLGALLKQLGLDLNTLAPNTDLISYLLAYLADPKGLAAGITNLVNGLVGTPSDPKSLEGKFVACEKVASAALAGLPGGLGSILGGLLDTLTSALTTGQSTLESAASGLVGSLAGAAGTNPLAPLASLLQKLIDIGVNVQPNGPKGPSGAAYVDPLQATPKQGTPVVKGQTIERAIEVNVAAAGGSSSLPGLGSIPGLGSLPGLPGLPGTNSLNAVPLAKNFKAAPAASGNTGILTLALGNAAAGPSTAPKTAPSSSAPAPTTSAPTTKVPTGVPAGMGTGGGSPALPLVLVLLTLALGAGGVATYRFRGGSAQH